MFMFWCVAPIEYNGSHLIYDKVDLKKHYINVNFEKDTSKNLFISDNQSNIQSVPEYDGRRGTDQNFR